jgi:hypothetical protein
MKSGARVARGVHNVVGVEYYQFMDNTLAQCAYPKCQLRFEPELVGARHDDRGICTGWFMPDAVTGDDREVSDNLPVHDHVLPR